ncbi:DNA adenine methylase [Candidatus Nitrosoglobus terrae]|uniref:Site-specific DNA-methyltransferase (adenine-specific) n=1 Tax=Candidatus Nitrosoglobus terrae TaxID=1630141 RepID=A0A1Q2SM80_9GAMM|nr:DpnII family type II restriction endonuclease [Candidatus Nitrosoglobus terrae]BAW80217.1 DNA adenine methylase [Candidatus Nitrosoglobus terrae]
MLAEKPKPFIKWVGGKRQLLKQFRDLKLYPPEGFNPLTNTYFEPFVGGGAVFFDLLPQKAALSDLNQELVITYNVIKNEVDGLIKSLKKHPYHKEYYLNIRAKKVEDLSHIEIASRFIYLNRTGFNGLYRVNKRGEFNVPLGRYTHPLICDEENLHCVSKVLQNTTIKCQDYKEVLKQAKKGDFIYFDPPYFPMSKTASFTAYTAAGFLEKEQLALRDTFVALSKRGCFVMLSNSDTPFINEIYSGIQGVKINQMMAARAINSNAARRGKITELLITNYQMLKKDFNYLVSTFKSSIKTWDYFVNWSKVFSNSSELEIVLNKLNYLLGKENLKEEFTKLYNTNPDIVGALPVLLAVRENTLEVFDKETKNSEFFDFSGQEKGAEKYFEFLDKSGLVRLFQKGGIKNLVDYVLGVEVGLDSNGRKNRGGSLMEKTVGVFLADFCKQNSFEYLPQARASTIKAKWSFDVKVDKSERSFDFAIYNPKTNKLKLFEANFYNGGGSKLKTVCGEFRSLYDELRAQNIDFIWITDGLGWRTAKRPLEETYNHNEYIFNLKMLETGILSELVW